MHLRIFSNADNLDYMLVGLVRNDCHLEQKRWNCIYGLGKNVLSLVVKTVKKPHLHCVGFVMGA